jgi:radical SAM protein with 4Fe4S-binding SPASM domain
MFCDQRTETLTRKPPVFVEQFLQMAPGVKTVGPGPGPRDLEAVAEGVHAFTAGRPPVRVYVDTALRGEWAELGLLDDPEPDVVGCGGGQRHVAVTPEGKVYPCSHARSAGYRMGNLLTDGPEDLWSKGTGLVARRRSIRDCQGVRCACRTP